MAGISVTIAVTGGVAGEAAGGVGESEERELVAAANRRIEEVRRAPLEVRVVGAEGEAVAGRTVRVEHVRHLYRVGAGFDGRILPQPGETVEDRRHREHFLRLFNYATVHHYWGSYERQQGQPEHEVRIRYARWLKAQGIVPRGHPVFWNQDNVLPPWLHRLDPAPTELRRLMDGRLAQMASTLLPELQDADIFNEITHWERFKNALTRLFETEGKVAVITHYLQEARRLNPNLKLVVNDYDASEKYDALLRQLRAAGAPFDVIGQQSHMLTGNWKLRQVADTLERHARFELPILFSEVSVLSGPRREIDWKTRHTDWVTDPEHEREQAEYVEALVRLLYSHPPCIGWVYWSYSDRGAWLGAPSGLLRKDGTPKPAYERLDRLFNQEWRTRGEWTTDAGGRVRIPAAFEGHYRITSGDLAAEGDHRASAPLQLTLKP